MPQVRNSRDEYIGCLMYLYIPEVTISVVCSNLNSFSSTLTTPGFLARLIRTTDSIKNHSEMISNSQDTICLAENGSLNHAV
jgi:hypothetical protein